MLFVTSLWYILESLLLMTSPNTMLIIVILTLPYFHPVYLSVFQKSRLGKSKQRAMNMELKKTNFLYLPLETKQVLYPRAASCQDLVPSCCVTLASEGLSQKHLCHLPQICIIQDARLSSLKSFLGWEEVYVNEVRINKKKSCFFSGILLIISGHPDLEKHS